MIIGEAFIEVRPDSTRFGPEAERSVLGSVTSIAKKAAAVIGTVFVADQARQFFTGAIGGATDLAESVNKNQVVFGAAADEVQRFAENAARGLGQSQAQALEATGVFGNLFRALEIGEKPAADMSTTLVQLASDLASFNNTSPEEALDALRAGIVGETEPLKRFGVNLNEATIKAKALALGIGDGKRQLTAAERAQAAYALILEQTTLAQGDFARTSGGLANQQRILAAQWADMQAKVGRLLLPAITKLAVFTNNTLLPGVENLARALGDRLGGAIDRVRGLIDGLTAGDFTSGLAVEIGRLVGLAEDSGPVGALAAAFDGVSDAVGNVAATVAAVIEPAIVMVRDGLGGAADSAREAWQLYATEGVGPVADAIERISTTADDVNRLLAEQRDILIPAAAAAAAFAAAFVTYTQVSRVVSTVQGALALLGPALGEAFAPLLANPVGLIIAGIVALAAAFTVAYLKVKPFRDAVDGVVRLVRDVAIDAFNILRDLVAAVGPALSAAASAVGSAIGSALGAVADVAGGVADAVISALEPIVTWVDENLVATFLAAADFIDALFDQLIRIARPFVRQFVATLQLVVGVVKDGLVAAFRIAGPIVSGALRTIGNVLQTAARVTIPIFLTAVDAVRTVVTSVFTVIVNVIEGALAVIRGLFTAAAGLLRGDFSQVWEGLKTVVEGPINAVRDIVVGVFGGMVDFIGGLPGRIGDVLGGLFDGIMAQARTFADTFSNTVRTAVDAVVGFFAGLPTRMMNFAASLGGASRNLGAKVLDKLLEGLGEAVGRIGELASGVARTIGNIGKNALNAVINAINRFLPDNIARVEIDTPVGHIVLFPGIDLPDNPIPTFAAGALVRRTPGGIIANIGEGAHDEAVLPLPPGLVQGLQAIAAGRGAGTVIEQGAVQVVGWATNPRDVAREAIDMLGWRLITTRNDR